MKIKEIKELSNAELTLKVKDLKQELFTINFQQALTFWPVACKKKEIRKDIARILTVLKEREMQASAE